MERNPGTSLRAGDPTAGVRHGAAKAYLRTE